MQGWAKPLTPDDCSHTICTMAISMVSDSIIDNLEWFSAFCSLEPIHTHQIKARSPLALPNASAQFLGGSERTGGDFTNFHMVWVLQSSICQTITGT